jgi:hypothetical protein
MIGNLHKRMEAVTAAGGIAAQIVGELVRRASAHDTIFKRLRDVHSTAFALVTRGAAPAKTQTTR